MQHPDPNRKKEPCKNDCVACKACKEREKIKQQPPQPGLKPHKEK